MSSYCSQFKICLIFGIIFFSFFLLIKTSQAAGNTYYVSTSGNDSNPGTQSSPWKTVSKVNNFNLQPGDTVLFNRDNTWSEQLIPKSGTGESTRITYGAYGSGSRPVIDNTYISSKQYIIIQDISFISQNSTPINITNSSAYIIVQNCEAIAAAGNNSTWAALFITLNAHHNKVINCKIERRNTTGQGDGLEISNNSHHNLVQGSSFGLASHYVLSIYGNAWEGTGKTADYNILRGNTVNNTLGANIGVLGEVSHTLVEDNIIYGTDKNTFNANPSSLRLAGPNSIVRRNIVHDVFVANGVGLDFSCWNPNGGSYSLPCFANRIYNNTIVDVDGGTNTSDNSSGGELYLDSDGLAPISDYIFVNNLFHATRSQNNFLTNWRWYNLISNVTLRSNLFFKSLGGYIIAHRYSGGKYYWNKVSDAQATYPSIYINNVQADPKLDSNYHPTSGSGAIDSGSFLTTITSPSGTGSTLVVADAKYFFDGYGIVAGDTIQIGTQLATITSINYTTNTLTLNQSISWTQNQGISLPYNGSKPDIGVYEYGGVTTTPTPTPTSTATPTPTFSKCDLNHDSSINVLDLQSLANVILGKNTCSFTCDLNQDSSVNVLDLQYLANVILGKNSCP